MENENSTEETSDDKIEEIVQRKIQEKLKKKDREIKELKQEIKNLKGRETSSKEKNTSTTMNRREFLKKAGLGAAGLGALALTPGSALDIKDSKGLQVFDGTDTGTEALDVNVGGPVEVKNADLNVKNSSGTEIINVPVYQSTSDLPSKSEGSIAYVKNQDKLYIQDSS